MLAGRFTHRACENVDKQHTWKRLRHQQQTRGNASRGFQLEPAAGAWPQVTHCPHRELVLSVCTALPFGCAMIKHVDTHSHHIIVAIQPLPAVVIERIFSTTATLRSEIHNQLPQSPLSVHNPAFACNILPSAVLWSNHPLPTHNADERWNR